MSISNAIKSYVKNYYEVTYNPIERQIILHDEFESKNSYTIELGTHHNAKIILVWGKIEETTGVQYHHKELKDEVSKIFFELIKEKKTKEFFKILVEENIHVNFGLSEVIEEFPILMG